MQCGCTGATAAVTNVCVHVCPQALDLLLGVLVRGSSRVAAVCLSWVPLLRFLVHTVPAHAHAAGIAASSLAGESLGAVVWRWRAMLLTSAASGIADVRYGTRGQRVCAVPSLCDRSTGGRVTWCWVHGHACGFSSCRGNAHPCLGCVVGGFAAPVLCCRRR